MSAFVLKLIACAIMLTDHIGAVFPAPRTPFVMREIGRIAFPIFAYMIAQGCKRTRNIYKYAARLLIFALISEIPFDLAFRLTPGINFLKDTNVYFTLFLGVACIALYELLKTKLKLPWPLALLLAVVPSALGNMLTTDYGTLGVAFILVFYFAKPENRIWRTAAMILVVFTEYGVEFLKFPSAYNRGLFLFALLAAPLVFLYNGKQGPKLKWSFYAFYPVHLSALAAAAYLLSGR